MLFSGSKNNRRCKGLRTPKRSHDTGSQVCKLNFSCAETRTLQLTIYANVAELSWEMLLSRHLGIDVSKVQIYTHMPLR